MTPFRKIFAGILGAVASTSAVGQEIDAELIYPYLVNPEYGFDGAPPTADGISYELGHKIYVSLVVDLDGLVTNLRLQDLKTLSLTPDQAHALALQNLEREWKAGRLKPTGFATPTGQKFVLVPDNWLASSCILLPQLSSLAAI